MIGRADAGLLPRPKTVRIQEELDARLRAVGCEVSDRWEHPLGPHIHFARLGAFLKNAGDPDWSFLAELVENVFGAFDHSGNGRIDRWDFLVPNIGLADALVASCMHRMRARDAEAGEAPG